MLGTSRWWAYGMAVVALVALVGSCGSPGEGDWSDECDTDSDCSSEQPYCEGGECYPCLEDSHCDGGLVCIKDGVSADSSTPYYCSECDPNPNKSPGCPDEKKCETPTCYGDTFECDGQGRCVEGESAYSSAN